MKGFTKDGKFHPIKPYNKVRKSRDPKAKSEGVRLKRERYARPAQLGVGARVILEKPIKNMMGDIIPDLKVGMKGTVVDHLSRKEPIIKFDQSPTGRTVVAKADNLSITRPSKLFDFEFVKAVGSAEQLKKRLLDMGYRYSDGGENFVYGYEYLDNGEGRSGDVPYSIELLNNRAKVTVRKGDIPNYWRFMTDEIIQQITDMVEEDLKI